MKRNQTTSIQTALFALQDKTYQQFQCKLMPTVDPSLVIGVRTPQLRCYAKEIYGTTRMREFLNTLPHTYYDENNLHVFCLALGKDYRETLTLVKEFLPYVDNWATCDQMNIKVFGKHQKELMKEIKIWIHSSETYTIRYSIGCLMRYYLDDNFTKDILKMVASVHSDEYYVNMMIAWFFATALAKQYDATIPYLEEHRLAPWIHQKTIQKARESYRIDDEKKGYLLTLK